MTLQNNIENWSDSVMKGTKQCGYWMVRTNSGTYFDLFVKDGYVALNRNTIPYGILHDAVSEYNNYDSIIKKVKKSVKESGNIDNSVFPDERSLSVAVSQVYKFVYDIKKGDIVIIPSENSDKICIGVFDENYIADNKVTNEKFVYTRKVTWIKQLEKRYFDPFFYKLFSSHQALCDVSNYKEYIERCIRSQFIIDNESHYVIALTSENIKARHLFKFGNLILELFEEYIQSEELNLDVNSIDTSINLNSPGRVDFKSNVKVGSLLMLFIPSILSGCINADGHQVPSEILQSISSFKESHSYRINELDSLINSLQVKKIEDSFDIINRDN